MGDPNDNLNVKDHTTSIGDNDNKNAKDCLGILALIAIMKLATESQVFRANKQPLKSHPSDKIQVLLDSVSNREISSYQKEKTNLFPT